MNLANVATRNNHALTELSALSDESRENLKHSLSDRTVKEYRSDLRQYAEWIADMPLLYRSELPHSPEMVSNWLSDMNAAGLSVSTLKRRLRAVSWIHKNHGHESPGNSVLVKTTMSGIMRRRAASGQTNTATSKTALGMSDLKVMCRKCDKHSLSGIRDIALLTLGFAGALRRSELVALQVSDVTVTGKGADIRVRRSKTDQYGEGATVSVVRGSGELCPVAALVTWLKASGITEGFIFRRIRRGGQVQETGVTGRTVADVIKKTAKAAGLDASKLSAHSLRSGLLTTAAEQGADLIQLQQHARHSDPKQTAHYIRHANRYKNNPTEGMF